MKRRLITAAMAAFVLFSFAACDLFNGLVNKQTEATTTTTEAETTTTAEETTTTEETTTEETTEETTSETTEETTSETTTATPTPTKAPTKKPTKIPTKPTYIPKGWSKDDDAWNKKYKKGRVYVIQRGNSYKGWYKGKWVKLYVTEEDIVEDGSLFSVNYFRDKKHKHLYFTYDDAP